MVNLTKANRFAFKSIGFIDNALHQLYNLTIRADYARRNCK